MTYIISKCWKKLHDEGPVSDLDVLLGPDGPDENNEEQYIEWKCICNVVYNTNMLLLDLQLKPDNNNNNKYIKV